MPYEKDSVTCKKCFHKLAGILVDDSHLFLLKTGIMGHKKRGAEAALARDHNKSLRNLEKAVTKKGFNKKKYSAVAKGLLN